MARSKRMLKALEESKGELLAPKELSIHRPARSAAVPAFAA
jgi:hypothetical protein